MLALLGRNGAERETVIETINEGNMSAMLSESKGSVMLLFFNL